MTALDVLDARLRLVDAPAADTEADARWVFRRVLLWLAWRWWTDTLAHIPEGQRDGLRGHAQDGLARADSLMFSLDRPTRSSVNVAHQCAIGIAVLCGSQHPSGPTVPVPLLGIRNLPTFPPSAQLGRPADRSSIRWCDRVDGRPPVAAEGPLSLVAGMADWYWTAASSRRPVCAHGVVHRLGKDACDPVQGRWGSCDGCCAPGDMPGRTSA